MQALARPHWPAALVCCSSLWGCWQTARCTSAPHHSLSRATPTRLVARPGRCLSQLWGECCSLMRPTGEAAGLVGLIAVIGCSVLAGVCLRCACRLGWLRLEVRFTRLLRWLQDTLMYGIPRLQAMCYPDYYEVLRLSYQQDGGGAAALEHHHAWRGRVVSCMLYLALGCRYAVTAPSNKTNCCLLDT